MRARWTRALAGLGAARRYHRTEADGASGAVLLCNDAPSTRQGPLSYEVPVWSRDGRRIFAKGSRKSGELVRCPLGSGDCATHMAGIDAEGVSYTRDAQWVAWVTPDGGLWRSRADGTERLQLTFPPLWAALPQWSPDGERICFARLEAGAPTRLMLVSADGGPPQEALPGDEGSQVDGEW